ncbi:hypothetical protein HY947_06565 [Candidatus Gottesmanbacteria bacterium]|nr:hypothetical protein [Candidatus Gottesmanbacteria bacterium]
MTKAQLSFDELFTFAKQKDSGLSEFYLAQSITTVDNLTILPSMKTALDRQKIVSYYQNLSRELLLRIKPK